MDLAALQVFQMVANERSYSRAAEKLFRTQPAVSIAMRKLEDWVGQAAVRTRVGCPDSDGRGRPASRIRRAHVEHARGDPQGPPRAPRA